MAASERSRSRGRRLWDFLSSHGGFAERMQAPVGQLVRENLGLRPGGAVLDVGCGSGGHLGTLRDGVGDGGRVVGVDFSPKMVEVARQRVARLGWTNVEVVLADVTRDGLGEEDFDAALATFALSAMPDVRAAVENVHAALRPGGRLLVLDLRFAPRGASGPLVWVLDRFYRLLAGRSGEDVLAELERVFARVDRIGGRGRSTAWPPVTLVLAMKRG